MEFEEFRQKFPNVSRETFQNLQRYAALLSKWNKSINLVAPDTIVKLWTRHISDSLQLMPYLPVSARNIVDVGSGAGLPGLVLAIGLHNDWPRRLFTLVDSDRRKCEFLRTVTRDLGLSVRVLTDRIEKIDPLKTDVIMARAVAPLSDLIGFAEMHLEKGGIALFMKGSNATSEIAEARRRWDFKMEALSSTTDAQATILKIEGIRSV